MWKSVVDLELGMEEGMSFAFNPRFGFLTAQPSHCGLGLSIRAILQVPASILAHTIRAYLSNEHSPVIVEGVDGHPHRFIGDLVVIRNRYSLGIKEENILSHIHKLATKLTVQERSLREKLSREFDVRVFDQIGRALGLLKYSYSLEMSEALDALSKIRLGIDLKWITGLQHREVTRMHFSCQRGHLSVQAENAKNFDPKHVSEARANFFRKELSQVSMKDMS
jgi:protein arginine kinase